MTALPPMSQNMMNPRKTSSDTRRGGAGEPDRAGEGAGPPVSSGMTTGVHTTNQHSTQQGQQQERRGRRAETRRVADLAAAARRRSGRGLRGSPLVRGGAGVGRFSAVALFRRRLA